MPRLLRVGLVLASLWVMAIGAFAVGRTAHRMVRGGNGTQDLAMYASLVRFAEHSSLSPAKGNTLAGQSDLRPLDVFATAESRLRANFYEKIADSRVLAFGTADGMLDSLQDPYSRFLEPEQLNNYLARQTGSYSGIGAILAVRRVSTDAMREQAALERERAAEDAPEAMPKFDDPADVNSVERTADGKLAARYDIYIAAVIPGGPAEAAGLRAGDTVHKVNGKLVFLRNLDSVEEMLSVPREGEVKLSVVRAAEKKQIEAKLAFRATRVSPVTARVADGVGIVTIRTVGAGVADLVRARINDLAGQQVKGIVLDLRSNGDGDYEEACALASVFIPSGPVAAFKERGGKFRDVPADAGRAVAKLPRLAAVVDGTTIGPAELVAGALKARKAAYLIGSTTQGHGSRQELYRGSGGTGILLTTALFYQPVAGTPGSVGIVEGKGVAPDLAVPAQGAGDAALQRALAWIKNGAA